MTEPRYPRLHDLLRECEALARVRIQSRTPRETLPSMDVRSAVREVQAGEGEALGALARLKAGQIKLMAVLVAEAEAGRPAGLEGER